MADTDKCEFVLYDTDLTTRLGLLPVASGHIYKEINEPGSGEIRIPLDTLAAAQVTSGQFVEYLYRGASRGGFFVDNIKETQADANENEGRWMSISGRGALAVLENAIVLNDGTNATTRAFSGTKAGILISLIDEEQALSGLASLTYNFTAVLDSDTNAWVDNESFELSVGTSLLDVLRQFAAT